nr:PREDICTED: mitotic spindle-associated MMXD complex subunit MIP18-like [Paralichthys olivaceus]
MEQDGETELILVERSSDTTPPVRATIQDQASTKTPGDEPLHEREDEQRMKKTTSSMTKAELEQAPNTRSIRTVFYLNRQEPRRRLCKDTSETVQHRVDDAESTVGVEFTPTIPHCSMATLIGLSIKVKLLRSLPDRFKIDVHITPGTHASEEAVNKQLADKERVAAALENSSLLEVVNQCLSSRSI